MFCATICTWYICLVSELDCSWDRRFEALEWWIRSVRGNSNPLLQRGRAAGGIFHGSISGRFITINQAMLKPFSHDISFFLRIVFQFSQYLRLFVLVRWRKQSNNWILGEMRLDSPWNSSRWVFMHSDHKIYSHIQLGRNKQSEHYLLLQLMWLPGTYCLWTTLLLP